jgi:LysR family transcriptional regulator, hypochlorite-specific transcription factor HypT
LRENFSPIKSRLIALNVHDAMLRLVEGSCDLLMVYHHEAQPIALDPERYEMVVLGEELLTPYVAPGADGAPLYVLPGQASHPLPYLGYAPAAYLGRMVEFMLKQSRTSIHLDRIYETDMAEGLKAMALEGQGLAFLPRSAVKKEVQEGRLLSAGAGLEVILQIRLYREKPSGKHPAKGAAQALWSYLQSQVELKGGPASKLLGPLPVVPCTFLAMQAQEATLAVPEMAALVCSCVQHKARQRLAWQA